MSPGTPWGAFVYIHSQKWGFRFPVTAVHRILGSQVTLDGSLGPDIAARAAKSARALRPIRATVAPRLALSLKAKVTLSEALASSVLFFAASAWTKLNASLTNKY